MKKRKDDYCEDLEFCLKDKKSFIMKRNYFFNCKNILSLIQSFPKICFCIELSSSVFLPTIEN
jgi:hypothetical protein